MNIHEANTTDDQLTRRNLIASQATGSAAEPATIHYTEQEHRLWQIISNRLLSLWATHASGEVLMASARLSLPTDRVPQLTEVTKNLSRSSGFEFRAVPGLVDKQDFFGALAKRRFLSTQFLRDPKTPFYTEEPDIVHEVLGHATLLADPRMAELHQLAGAALIRVRTERARQFIADVWWFSGEFGVIIQNGEPKALGAGLLSSVGEITQFADSAEIRPLDITQMGLTNYRIDEFQKILFRGDSIEHLLDLVGGFFSKVDDEMVKQLIGGKP